MITPDKIVGLIICKCGQHFASSVGACPNCNRMDVEAEMLKKCSRCKKRYAKHDLCDQCAKELREHVIKMHAKPFKKKKKVNKSKRKVMTGADLTNKNLRKQIRILKEEVGHLPALLALAERFIKGYGLTTKWKAFYEKAFSVKEENGSEEN